MISCVILTSNSTRHIYFSNYLSTLFSVKGIISEPKEDYFESQKEQSLLVTDHFEKLKIYEKKYLGDYKNFPKCPQLLIGNKQINQEETLKWALEKNADFIFLFGTGILDQKWLLAFKDKIINLHLGYSPRYRGSATLFWPFYHDEIKYVGATIHLASSKIDGGAILKVVTPSIKLSDNYYDINFKTIKTAISEFGFIASDYSEGKIEPKIQNKIDEKYFYRKSDFNELVLRKVIDKYGV